MRTNDFRLILGSVVLLCAIMPTRQTGYAFSSQGRAGTGDPCAVQSHYNFLPGATMRMDPSTGRIVYSNQEARFTVSKECSQPLKFPLDILADLSRSARGWKGTSAIWIEPLGASEFGMYLWTELIPTNGRAVFGDSAPAPTLNGELKFVSGPDGGTGNPLLTDGMTVWGATQGPLNINGRARCNIRAAQIVNGDLAPAFLCETPPLIGVQAAQGQPPEQEAQRIVGTIADQTLIAKLESGFRGTLLGIRFTLTDRPTEEFLWRTEAIDMERAVESGFATRDATGRITLNDLKGLNVEITCKKGEGEAFAELKKCVMGRGPLEKGEWESYEVLSMSKR